MKITFITGNEEKLRIARQACQSYGVEIEHRQLNIPEIQAEDGAIIAEDKARKAFEILHKPVIVTDDSWIIGGLGGFPGPYMKPINHWLKLEDWLRLTLPLEDRRVTLNQIIAYHDETDHRIFSLPIEGQLLTEPRGASPSTLMTLTSFDNGAHSVAELNGQGKSAITQHRTSWHDLCEWLAKQPS